MLIDGRRLRAGETHRADVCIVGAGAAGITLALELAAKGYDVALIESGGFEPEAATQQLYAGSVDGSQPSPGRDYLRESRSRFVGGTTNQWEGWCRPFDAIDFAARDWIPRSGWPIDRAQLDPYYERAWKRLRSDRWGEDVAADALAPEDQVFASGKPFRTIFFHRPPPLRFGSFHRDELVASTAIRLFVWSNAIEIVTNETASAVVGMRIGVLDGPTFLVRARCYCLAAGGIETPRLLLASNAVQKEGLGNRHDMVGRCFMEHPRFEAAGGLLLRGSERALRLLQRREVADDHLAFGVLAATAESQRAHRLVQTCVGLQFDAVPEMADSVADLTGVLAADRSSGNTAAPATTAVGLLLTCEQYPNPESRVLLADTRDSLGVPQVRLQWRLSEADHISLRNWIVLLARELGRSSLGRVASFIDDEDPWRDVVPSAHHMGTTRMGESPESCVVDADLRVHGIDNLFVASSSTFPTGGLASPTPTIVALAIRLAEHLSGTKHLARGTA